jgi:tight adherence protein C
MNIALIFAMLSITLACAAAIMIIVHVNMYSLNLRVSKSVTGLDKRSASLKNMTSWLSKLGHKYRRFYSMDSLEQQSSFIQSSGLNPYRALPIWIGVKTISMTFFPIFALLIGEILSKPINDLVFYVLMGEVIGILAPRLVLLLLKQRFSADVLRGTPDTIDLLVICSEAGMGLETALEIVAQDMKRSNPTMSRVLFGLLDDLLILPNRHEAFAHLGSISDELRRFGSMMSQSLQYGTSLSQSLRAIADEIRRDSIIKLEEKAHKLSAKLLIPMVLFLLPAMFIILGASSFLHLSRSFQ